MFLSDFTKKVREHFKEYISRVYEIEYVGLDVFVNDTHPHSIKMIWESCDSEKVVCIATEQTGDNIRYEYYTLMNVEYEYDDWYGDN